MRLNIQGEYPPDWKVISDATWAAAGHRCIRCSHPYRKGESNPQWSQCDEQCRHGGPLGYLLHGDVVDAIPNTRLTAAQMVAFVPKMNIKGIVAEYRVGTVHHLDGNKSNCVWWNLLALCQRCHLTIQSRVDPQISYFLDHSEWFKPYVAGFYAKKYEGKDVTREEAEARMEQLLAYEKVA